MILTILKPKYYEFRASLQKRGIEHLTWIFLFIAFNLFLGIVSYDLGNTIRSVTGNEIILLITITSLPILFIAGIIRGFNSLLYGEEISFLLSKPTGIKLISQGKVFEIIISSIWVLLLMMLSVFIGISFSNNSASLLSLLSSIGCLVTPVLLGIIFSVLFVIETNLKRATSISILFIACLLPNFLTVDSIINLNDYTAESLFILVSSLSVIVFVLIQESLNSTFHKAFSEILRRGNENILTRGYHKFSTTNSLFRTLLLKEYRTILRDPAQAVQVVFLFLFSIFYLITFKSTAWADATPKNINGILFMNLTTSIVFSTIFCSRLVYPSISLEGESIWSIVSSPISSTRYVLYKFLTWVLPCVSISSIFIVVGHMSITTDLTLISAELLTSALIACSFVSISLKTGFTYAKFDWKNVGEVTSNFGSIVNTFKEFFILILNIPLLFILFYSKMYLIEALVLVTIINSFITIKSLKDSSRYYSNIFT